MWRTKNIKKQQHRLLSEKPPYPSLQRRPISDSWASPAPAAWSWPSPRVRTAGRKVPTAASGRSGSGARPCTAGSHRGQEHSSLPCLSALAPLPTTPSWDELTRATKEEESDDTLCFHPAFWDHLTVGWLMYKAFFQRLSTSGLVGAHELLQPVSEGQGQGFLRTVAAVLLLITCWWRSKTLTQCTDSTSKYPATAIMFPCKRCLICTVLNAICCVLPICTWKR